jgi:hypothetical protein
MATGVTFFIYAFETAAPSRLSRLATPACAYGILFHYASGDRVTSPACSPRWYPD